MEKITWKARSLWAKKSKDGSSLWLPLASHLADSAAIAQKLWNRWLTDGVKQAIAAGLTKNGNTEQLFVFLAAAHDIGKATPVFQAKSSEFSDLDGRIEERLRAVGLLLKPLSYFSHKDKTPHALATQLLLEQAGLDRSIAVILGGHHGKPPDRYTLMNCGIGTYGENFFLGKEGIKVWSAVQQELIDFALKLAGFPSVRDVPIPNMAAQVLLNGLVIMADWIASNEAYFPYICLEDEPETDARSRAESAWKLLALPYPWDAGKAWVSADLYQERFSFSVPNAMQSTVTQAAAVIHEPGILVLEAPMGSGKTEAALVAAEIFAAKAKRKGVFFALPTQATSDGIFPRMLDWVEKLDSDEARSIRLVHGKAQFNEKFQSLAGGASISDDEDGGVIVHEWFEGRKKSMLDDFVVGTIDQLLLTALKQKHVMLRHLGLANKVVVIDECHAYDAYMSRYLDMALRWLGTYRVPVIVLSATLPVQKRQAVIDAYLNRNSTPKQKNDPLGRSSFTPVQTSEWLTSRDYPLITWTDGGEIRQKAVLADGVSREVRLAFLAEDALVDRLDNLLSGGGCAGVIVNTVKRAQELARALRERFGEETVRLLHSRFLAPDRAKKEEDLLKELGKPAKDRRRPSKRIVVGTQVLEQSLDIDFDVLITDICPMDMLLQRVGRLHRHKRARPEKLTSALCLIMGLDGDSFEVGTKAVYGEYLLMRTKALLPQRFILPRDIPALVQDVYHDGIDLSPEPSGYREAKEEWDKLIADKEKRAEDFRICRPWSEATANLVDWLNTDVSVSDKHGEATVRDTDESIETLLIREKSDGELYFLPWMENGRRLPYNETPDSELARALARCSVRLPTPLCVPWAIDKTIKALERLCAEQLSEWQKSPWLKGALFLILDEEFSADLCGYRLIYDKDYGLMYEKEVGPDA